MKDVGFFSFYCKFITRREKEYSMKNYQKYQRGYFMPPINTMKWAQKEYIDRAPIW